MHTMIDSLLPLTVAASEKCAVIRRLFPEEVVTVAARPSDFLARLLPEEEVLIRRGVPKRVREFRAGRSCARRALRQLGIEGFPLLAREDRTPIWPAGITGSISHCDGACAVAIARIGDVISLGFDVESAEPLDEELVPVVCTSKELDVARRSTAARGVDLPKLIFSAKESVFKAHYPVTATFLEFHDIQVSLDAREAAFDAWIVGQPETGGSHAQVLRGRFGGDGSHVFTGVTAVAPGVK